MTQQVTTLDRERERQDWTTAVGQLVDQVCQWALDQNWTIALADKTINEQHLGTYTVPRVDIATGIGTLTVEPIARDVFAGDGRVDLIARPSFNRLLLVRAGDRWVVKTDSGIEWPAEWSRETFVDLVRRLGSAR